MLGRLGARDVSILLLRRRWMKGKSVGWRQGRGKDRVGQGGAGKVKAAGKGRIGKVWEGEGREGEDREDKGR